MMFVYTVREVNQLLCSPAKYRASELTGVPRATGEVLSGRLDRGPLPTLHMSLLRRYVNKQHVQILDLRCNGIIVPFHVQDKQQLIYMS